VAFTSLGEVTGDVKVLKVNGVAPTHETIRNKTYPLTRTLTFATKGEPKPQVKAFIEWATNKEGQSQVAKAGYTAASEQAVATVPPTN
jgi:phosphate transport system substrate-binding protein